ncbi:MAG: glycosyltransferase family 2 protein [Acidimicrobiia bacterium]
MLPRLSVVVLAWDQPEHTRRCVQSIRDHTDTSYELVVVDNGSRPEAARYAEEAADRAILNPTNRGFAAGMNQGLAAARGELVAFCNNDIALPPAWASPLLEDFRAFPEAGLVVPAVTAAGNPVTVRSQPGQAPRVLAPFQELPSAVVYLMGTETCRELGGFDEAYRVATGEDIDLCFKVWANGLSIVLEERVLVEHASEASRRALPDHHDILRHNRDLFVRRWSDPQVEHPRLKACPEEVFRRNLAEAATAARWLGELFAARDELAAARADLRRLERQLAKLEAGQGSPAPWMGRPVRAWVRRWRGGRS